MIIVKVKEVVGIKDGTNKSGKSYRMAKLLVEQQDTHDKYVASMFVHGDIPEVGMEINADIVKKGQYFNINKWHEVGKSIDINNEVFKGSLSPTTPKATEPVKSAIEPQKQPIVSVSQTTKEPNWDKKELRGHRRACLAIVSSQLKLKENESELDWADRVIAIAELRFLDYVYEGYDKPEKC